MTMYPQYLTDYPNRNSPFPFSMSINTLKKDFPAHRHDYLEFSYVIAGTGSETINGVTHPMNPGTFTLVLPYEVHELHIAPNEYLKLYNCSFGLDLLLGTLSNLGLDTLLMESDERIPYVHLENNQASVMKVLFERMHQEYQGDHIWRHALLGAALIEALVLFDRSRRQTLDLSSAPTETATIDRVWEVIHYVHMHYKEDLSLSDLAVHFHFSMSHLSELFKKYVGQNFVFFLHELRIRHALGLLKSTQMSVSEIAYDVGFGSYKTFSRVFRQMKQMTPMEFRKLTEASKLAVETSVPVKH